MIINYKKGTTLLELLIYISTMAVLLVVLTGIIVKIYGLYREFTISPRVDQVGLAVVDRVVKEIRSGKSINLGNSSFGTATGSLNITASEEGTDIIKYFQYQDGKLMYSENSGVVYSLTPSDINVSEFRLTQINTPISQAVRVDFDLTFNTKEGIKTKEYHGVAILRQSYE
jgi:hypothetical protein